MGIPLGLVLLPLLLLNVAGAPHEEAPAANRDLTTGFHLPVGSCPVPMYYQGSYHLFYQYNPEDAVWAHSVSHDLINWVALEGAIRPNIKADKYGCFSGSATMLLDGTPSGDNPAGKEHHPQYDHGNFYASKTFYDPSKQRKILWGWASESKGWAGIQESKGWAGIQGSKGWAGIQDSKGWAGVQGSNGWAGIQGSKGWAGIQDSKGWTGVQGSNGWAGIQGSKGWAGIQGSKGWAGIQGSNGWAGIQAIPRKVWLDQGDKQLLQWPVEEVDALRRKLVSLSDQVIKPGDSVEVTGLQTAQADVEVTFEVPSMEGMEVLHPALANDAQKLCSLWGADKKGGVGPFGLWVLASAKLEEKTAVFFRVFRVAGRSDTKPVVLMCTDTTRSSLSPNLYRPTFAGFVETDFSQGKITLRSLIDRSVVESFGAGGRTCILSRVYPSLATGKNAHLHVFNNGKADIKVSQLAAWEMKPALMNGA
ncbi:hypothetical protein ACQ4PT_034638 [Festuca glaucescens]